MRILGSSIGLLANVATLVLALTTLAFSVLRRSNGFRRWCLASPLRKALPIRGQASPSTEDVASLLGVSPSRASVVAALRTPSLRVLDGEKLTPGDAMAELLPPGRGGVSTASVAAEQLRVIYAKSIRGSNSSLLARVLYADDVTRVTDFHQDLVRALEPFAQAVAVEPGRSGATPGRGASFAGFVTALSGAPVLVDASAIRSRHADGVLVWHRRQYRDAVGVVRGSGYEGTHERGFCSSWSPLAQMPGDFDRRMLDLRSVALLESSTEGTVNFALGTWETCYAATEQGNAHGCKKVPVDPRAHDAAVDPVFSAQDNELLQGLDTRLTLLTSYVSVLTSDGSLVLARRSSTVRNGADVISASAGGIVEIDEPGPKGDICDLGTPDPVGTALRETREEIGLELLPHCIKPVAVFLANARDRPRAGESRGQLVGVVLSLARTDESVTALQRGGNSRSDLSKGRFEWEELVTCPTESASAMADWARSNAPDLDQHGLLSVVYAAMTLHGQEATRREFELKFDDGPWWCGPAAGSWGSRVCRDPGALVGTATEDLLGRVSSRWLETWTEYVGREPSDRLPIK